MLGVLYYSAPRLNGLRLNGHPALLAKFLNSQFINLHQICPDNRPTPFNGQKSADKMGGRLSGEQCIKG